MNLSTWQTILVASTTMKQHVSVNGFVGAKTCVDAPDTLQAGTI